jgi:hypothetical protein
MDTDRQTGQVSYQDEPAVAVRFVRPVLPFQDEPEYQGCKQAGVGVDFAFYGTEPECITPRISQRSNYSGAHDGNQFTGSHLVVVRTNQFFSQVGNAPEQEQDTGGTHQGTHDIDHAGYLRRVAGKLTEQVGGKHKERCAGRVADFQFITGGNEFRAIPEAGGRFDGHAVRKGCNDESQPTYQVVDRVVLFHELFFLVNVNRGKDSKHLSIRIPKNEYSCQRKLKGLSGFGIFFNGSAFNAYLKV